MFDHTIPDFVNFILNIPAATGQRGRRQVTDAEVSVRANAVGMFSGTMLLTKS